MKSCCCKLFYSNQLHLFGGKKSLNDGIQYLAELLVVEVDFNIIQNEKKHSNQNIYTNVS